MIKKTESVTRREPNPLIEAITKISARAPITYTISVAAMNAHRLGCGFLDSVYKRRSPSSKLPESL